ncbi:MAG: hypothetical protein OXC83_04510 [Chloroflexi bacterium]|nr:hypothetical protein [Chloroflexota bacterium]
MAEPKRKRQPKRPYTLPEPIPDTFANVTQALVSTPPKDQSEWRYLKRKRG